MNPRTAEAALLDRCAVAAREAGQAAQDACEANVFRVAALVIRSSFPVESTCLMRASERYFVSHPNDKVDPKDVIRKGWILTLPRLHDMLIHRLNGMN